MLAPQEWPFRLLAHPVLTWLGAVSYFTYLFHQLFSAFLHYALRGFHTFTRILGRGLGDHTVVGVHPDIGGSLPTVLRSANTELGQTTSLLTEYDLLAGATILRRASTLRYVCARHDPYLSSKLDDPLGYAVSSTGPQLPFYR